MHSKSLAPWSHAHAFGQAQRRPGERRTMIVIAITATMMVIEIIAGVSYGSMALLADGLHMASHTVALSVSAFAYIYARRHAHDPRYTIGTGKVNALGGFSGAVLLAGFALLMVWESGERFLNPVEIVFNQAILVALAGLMINGLSAFILTPPSSKEHHHDHSDNHHDHNLKSAYLHVIADALTSVLAIVALLMAKYAGMAWVDPAMGIVGAALVARWSFVLMHSTSCILLDRQGPESIRRKVREAIERDGDSKVSDLHLWSIGPGLYAVVLTVVASAPSTPEEYRLRLPEDPGLVHISIEIHPCPKADP